MGNRTEQGKAFLLGRGPGTKLKLISRTWSRNQVQGLNEDPGPGLWNLAEQEVEAWRARAPSSFRLSAMGYLVRQNSDISGEWNVNVAATSPCCSCFSISGQIRQQTPDPLHLCCPKVSMECTDFEDNWSESACCLLERRCNGAFLWPKHRLLQSILPGKQKESWRLTPWTTSQQIYPCCPLPFWDSNLLESLK